jgi:uncharacterized protein (UPF0371 family)
MSTPFNAQKYRQLQSEKIKERLSKFDGKLYLEIGGKFLNDEHASRVLPGFESHVKVEIVKDLGIPFEILFCISSTDINEGRVWKSGETYEETILRKLNEITGVGLPKPVIIVNLYDPEPKTKSFEKVLQKKGYTLYRRYFIEGYPENIDRIASDEGFGKDDYINTEKDLILVIGAGSLSGKMSSCLGQVYHDTKNGIDSGYAKYETFPIWNLPIDHPVNLAYEAATADIGDYNVYDHFYEEAYGEKAVNYNRDVEAFVIIRDILNKIVSEDNYMREYKSPTDMGISTAGFCIEDDEAVGDAAVKEVKRRIREYRDLVESGRGKEEWVERCEALLEKAKSH